MMNHAKQKAQASWQAADYATFATSLERGLDDFVPRLAIQLEHQVLDVACGTGNFAMRAAVQEADVTGIDFNPDALDVARQRAEAAGLDITFDQGDIEVMPYSDNRFDWGVSVFGIMFAINSEAAAAELCRVVKPGGKIALTSWTPDGLVGQLAKTLAKYKKADPGTARTSGWGHESTVRELLEPHVSELQIVRRMWRYEFPYGAPGVVDFFRRYSGSHIPLFAQLDENGRNALYADLIQVWNVYNQVADGETLVADAEYLEIIGAV